MRYLSLVALTLCLLCGCGTTPQEKAAKTSTSELKLRHAQCEQFLNAEKKQFEIKFGNPLFMGDGGREDRIKEKEAIEMELLRRYQNGDKDAYLPIFPAS